MTKHKSKRCKNGNKIDPYGPINHNGINISKMEYI